MVVQMPKQRMKLDNRTGEVSASSFSETRAPFSRSMIHHDFSMMNTMLNSNTPVQSESIFKPVVYHACPQTACLNFNYPSSFDCDLNQPESWKNDMMKYYDPLQECFVVSDSIFNQANVAFPIIPDMKLFFEFDLMLVEGEEAIVHLGGVYLDLSYALIDVPEWYCPEGSYDWTGSNGVVVNAVKGEWVTCKNLYLNGEPKTGIGKEEFNWKHYTMKYFQPIMMLNEGSKGTTLKIRNIRVWYESDTKPDSTYTCEYGFYIGGKSTNLLKGGLNWMKKSIINCGTSNLECETSLDYEGNTSYSLRTFSNNPSPVLEKGLKLAEVDVVEGTTYTAGLNYWISDHSKFTPECFSVVFSGAARTISSYNFNSTKLVDSEIMVHRTMQVPAGATKAELWFNVAPDSLGCRFFLKKFFITEGEKLCFASPDNSCGGMLLHYDSLNMSNNFTHFLKLAIVDTTPGELLELQDTYGKSIKVSVDADAKVVVTHDAFSLMNKSPAIKKLTSDSVVATGDVVTILLQKFKLNCLTQVKVRSKLLNEIVTQGEESSHYHTDLIVGHETSPACAFFLNATMIKSGTLLKKYMDSMHDSVGNLDDMMIHAGFSEGMRTEGFTIVDMDKFYHNGYGSGYITRSLSNNIIRTSCPVLRSPDRWYDIRPFTKNNATPYGMGYTYMSGSLTKEFNEHAYGPTWMSYTPHPTEEGSYMLLSGWIHATTDCDLEEIGYFIEGHAGVVDLKVYDMSNKGQYQFCYIKVVLGDKPVKIMTSPKSKSISPEFSGQCVFSGMNIVISKSEGLLPGASPTNASTIDKFRFKLYNDYGLKFNEDWTIFYRKTPICGCNNTENGAVADYLGRDDNFVIWGKDEELSYIIGSGPVKLKDYWMTERDIMLTYNKSENKLYFYEFSLGELWSRVIVKEINAADELVREDGTDLLLGGTPDESHGAIISSLMISQKYTTQDEFNKISRERGMFSAGCMTASEFIEF